MTTRVPLLREAEEKAVLRALEANPPASLVVVSDLHLGEGVEQDAAGRETGRFYRRENFFADSAFHRFLGKQNSSLKGPVLLVFNGDIFDFLRVDDTPSDDAAFADWQKILARLEVQYSKAELEQSVTSHERAFGLQTNDYKSIYKFKIMARGHPTFFRALAEWIRNGNRLLYLKGNHDVEQHWPLIRRAFRDEIHLAGAEAADVTRLVSFADDWVQLANVYFEHGHAYEVLTRVNGPAVLARPAGQLNLPLGSFVNRYIINRLERIEPFLDNIKPVTDVLWELVRRRPVSVFRLIQRGVVFLYRATVQRRGSHVLLALAIVGISLTQIVPFITILGVGLYVGWPRFAEWLGELPVLHSSAVRTVLSLIGLALPYLIGIGRELWPSRQPPIGEDKFAAGGFAALRSRVLPSPQPWKTLYAVLGHTHAEDVQALPPVQASERTLYINTGTWIPRWSKDRPDLSGKVLHVFARFHHVGLEYVHEILFWDDVAGDARPPIMLTPE